MERFILGSHVLAGMAALLFGLGALVLGRKGGWIHRRSGKVYFLSMGWIFISSLAVLLLYRFNSLLVFLSIFSFYQAFTGFRVLRRKSPGSHTLIDWAGAITAISVTLAVALGVLCKLIAGRAGLQEGLSLFFGVFALRAAQADIKVFRGRTPLPGRWWLYHHIQSMVGSFIGAVTAFLVQNGARFFPHAEFQWVFWITPTVVGTGYIFYSVGKYKRGVAEPNLKADLAPP